MDGNFSMAPKLFKQLYVIRASVGDVGGVTGVYIHNCVLPLNIFAIDSFRIFLFWSLIFSES